MKNSMTYHSKYLKLPILDIGNGKFIVQPIVKDTGEEMNVAGIFSNQSDAESFMLDCVERHRQEILGGANAA